MSIVRRIIEMFPSYEFDGIMRYYITFKDRPSINVFVHSMSPSDEERFFHNHPWKVSISFVLSGMYIEEIYDGKTYTLLYRSRFTFKLLTQKMFHRILRADDDTWTLFVTIGRSDDEWGNVDQMGRFFKRTI